MKTVNNKIRSIVPHYIADYYCTTCIHIVFIVSILVFTWEKGHELYTRLKLLNASPFVRALILCYSVSCINVLGFVIK